MIFLIFYHLVLDLNPIQTFSFMTMQEEGGLPE